MAASILLLGLAHWLQGASHLPYPLVFHPLGGCRWGLKTARKKKKPTKNPWVEAGGAWGGCGQVVPCAETAGSASPNLQIIQRKQINTGGGGRVGRRESWSLASDAR